MIAFSVGKQLGNGDLSISVRDTEGKPQVPSYISYSIFNVSGKQPSLVSDPKATPAPGVGTGQYWVNMTIPTSWVAGDYRLVWYLQQNPDTIEVSIYEDFSIVQTNAISSSLEAPSVFMSKRLGITENSANLVMMVRELLSDTNPDRNYHFRPPTAGKVVAGFTQRVGYIWTDQAILRFLNLAIAKINSGNPKNFYSFTIDNIPDNWYQAAALGAAASALMAEAIRWNAEEFSYSLNGVSLDINKASSYQGLAESFRTEFNEWIIPLTANRPTSMGLRQPRWLI
jgi:hypothetical protein